MLKDWIKKLEHVSDFGMFSQANQDAIIVEIFKNIGTFNTPPFCVEFGFNHSELQGGSGSNVARMLLREGWKGLLLDGEYENEEINLKKQFLTSENICDVFRRNNVPKCPEYVSIDVDSTDLWLFNALLKDFRAMVFSVEYNCNFPLEAAITFPNDPNQHWKRDRGYGASLKSLVSVASQNGYSLLWVVPRFDAIFIRDDLIEDGSSELVFPFEKWRKYTNISNHAPVQDAIHLDTFIDYDLFLKTNDLALSRKAARLDTKAFLTDSLDWESIRRRGPKRQFKDSARNFRRGVKRKLRRLFRSR